MTLTKSDLQAISKLIDSKSFATKNDLKKLEAKMATKMDIQRIEKKFDDLFDFLDRDVMKNRKDMWQIQSHLGIETSDFHPPVQI